MDPEHTSFEGARCHKYVWSTRPCFLPGSHYYSTSWAALRGAGKLCESLSRSIARQRSEIASEPSIGPCLRPPFKEISTFSSCDKICSPVVLRIRDVGSPELLGKLSLIPLVCFLRFLSRSDVRILSTPHLKPAFATHSFDPTDHPYPPVALLLYELSCS